MRCRVWLFALMTFTAMGLSAVPAWAGHGWYVTNSPTNASVYSATSPPTSVTVHFSDAGGLKLGSLRVYDQQGRVLSSGGRLADDDSTIEQPLPKLEAGRFVVAWQVTLANADSVHGAFVFSVKAHKPDVNKVSRRPTAAAVQSTKHHNTRTAGIVVVVLIAMAIAATASAAVGRRRAT